ncbi:transcription elongation factor, GreA/GreB, family protein [Chlamydia psittaci 03DC35]|nr:transcription elongation factor, GreA/GreB, family protein [Chlamydia psittaci 02DC23]EPJ27778.1 transcription elongation factor, GreA/GreB, family protein [Chlamydia psittaci C19/98]EPJ31443.1 transcription elongation factor, GreA/GreB, family protein [Chlamydia psittaci 03DC35]EPJ98372.1 transcription elongation factor, GreA/GreB, family protein [Chlamydia psittaci 02DC24]
MWEEYCFNDVVRGAELVQILEKVKHSSLAPLFGKISDSVLPLWERIPEGKEKDQVLRLVLDIQNTNAKPFYDAAIDYVNRKYHGRENFNEALRVVGLRDGREFQYSLSRFDFLMHLNEGNFVFHSGGWGVGEVMSVSFLQQKVLIEFEGVMMAKDISFETAFKSLIPLDKDHFLSRRFGDPDGFEAYAKDHPSEVIEILLKDLGPKTAKEIKDELVDLVIPEADWNRWWQATKSKIKKNTRIVAPKTIKDPYRYNPGGDSLISQLETRLSQIEETQGKIIEIYQFIRDLHSELKKPENREIILNVLQTLPIEDNQSLEIQRDLLLSDFLGEKSNKLDSKYIASLSEEGIISIVNAISIAALQKAFLMLIKKHFPVWENVFMKIFFSTTFPALRELSFKVLKGEESCCQKIKEKLLGFIEHPMMYPEVFVWFFLKFGSHDDGLFDPNDKEIERLFLEAAMVFMYHIASTPQKELGKKIYNFLVSDRYLVIRNMIEGAPLSYLKEILLLSTKCSQFSSSDLSVLQSVAEVVQPDLKKNTVAVEEDILWTTPESFTKMKNKLQSLVGKEMVDNAKEIEDARALGDLRENSEYKFALEKRARLQEEIRVLSEEVNRARILTKDIVFTDTVGVGCKVSLEDEQGNLITYSILGPWDADPDNYILSLKSKLAQEMLNKSVGASLQFQGKKYKISRIQSIWDA